VPEHQRLDDAEMQNSKNPASAGFFVRFG
jgi:hypothetical protein